MMLFSGVKTEFGCQFAAWEFRLAYYDTKAIIRSQYYGPLPEAISPKEGIFSSPVIKF